MKLVLLTICLITLSACSGSKHNAVGTIVSVERTLNKACDFGTIVLQPGAMHMAGSLIKINIDDMDDKKEEQISRYLNKKVSIQVDQSASHCSKSTIDITEIE